MAILAGIFFIGLGLYVLNAPHNWSESEWIRYDNRTRRSTLHPKIGGPLAIVIGIGLVIFGGITAIKDNSAARATQDARTVSEALEQAFAPIFPVLQTQAEAQPGVILTLTAGERERAGLSEEVMVYYGWCSIQGVSSPFYIVIQNWNGNDYQHGFPFTVFGGCGGRLENMESVFNGNAPRWLQLRAGSFNYEQIIEATMVAPTVSFQETQWALTATSQTNPTPTAQGN